MTTKISFWRSVHTVQDKSSARPVNAQAQTGTYKRFTRSTNGHSYVENMDVYNAKFQLLGHECNRM